MAVPYDNHSIGHKTPDELWRLILRFATLTPTSSILYDVEHAPFRESWVESLTLDDSLPIKLSVILVCQHWRSLAMEFLYEHVRVTDLVNLRELHEAEAVKMYGKYVCRLELPSRPLQDRSVTLLDVLGWCPRVQVLIQPSWVDKENDGKEFWTILSKPSSQSQLVQLLGTLSRIDWCLLGDGFIAESCRARLVAVLTAASGLKYLSLRYKVDPFPQLEGIILKSLTTLRLQGPIGLYGLVMPKLTHLIVNDVQVNTDSSLLSNVGSQLQLLQLTGYGDGFRFDVFRLSPGLRDFCCTVNRDTIVVIGVLHPMVETVRLFCGGPPDSQTVIGFKKKSSLLTNGTSFPKLARLVLYGPAWKSFAKHSDFRLLRERLLNRGCSVQYDNGEPVL